MLKASGLRFYSFSELLFRSQWYSFKLDINPRLSLYIRLRVQFYPVSSLLGYFCWLDHLPPSKWYLRKKEACACGTSGIQLTLSHYLTYQKCDVSEDISVHAGHDTTYCDSHPLYSFTWVCSQRLQSVLWNCSDWALLSQLSNNCTYIQVLLKLESFLHCAHNWIRTRSCYLHFFHSWVSSLLYFRSRFLIC